MITEITMTGVFENSTYGSCPLTESSAGPARVTDGLSYATTVQYLSRQDMPPVL